MSGAMEMPEGLAEMPPGPELSALLATLDPTRLHAVGLIDLLAARNRQICYEQAQLLKAVRELAFSSRSVYQGEPVRDLTKDPFADTEIAFALTWTDYAAQAAVAVALSTIDRTPKVLEAMQAGLLDLPKAKIIATELDDATDEHARLVVAGLLPEVQWCTTAQLRDKVRRLLLRLDPDAVRKRHKKALESRWVQHTEYSNGTAAVAGIYLPKDKAAAAYDHVNAIAKATKAAGGDDREIDQIRADVFADLLAGVDPTLAGAVTPAARKGVVNLHIGLTTLAGLDEYPGEIEGFGPVIAGIARDTAAQMAETARWRFTVTDDNGETVAEGPLRRPPATTDNDQWSSAMTRNAQPSNATADNDNDNDNDNGNGYGYGYGYGNGYGNGSGNGSGSGNGNGNGSGSGNGNENDSGSGSGNGDRDGYRPTARQKAFVLARDRTCRAPGCRRPARACDLDHIMDWAYSRETSITNLLSLCRRHHRAKHKGHFRVQRTMSGIDWITPCGRHYTVIPDLAPPPSIIEHELSQDIHGFRTPGQLRR